MNKFREFSEIDAFSPLAIAFAKSPENFIPPSAIIGILCLLAASAQSFIAVNWGTPTPATILVVQIEPGPMPTLTASAPAPINAFVASLVATLPATICILLSRLILLTTSLTDAECPWAVSIHVFWPPWTSPDSF